MIPINKTIVAPYAKLGFSRRCFTMDPGRSSSHREEVLTTSFRARVSI